MQCDVTALQIHAGMQASVKGFRHGVLDVEDAVWQMLMEVRHGCTPLLQILLAGSFDTN